MCECFSDKYCQFRAVRIFFWLNEYLNGFRSALELDGGAAILILQEENWYLHFSLQSNATRCITKIVAATRKYWFLRLPCTFRGCASKNDVARPE